MLRKRIFRFKLLSLGLTFSLLFLFLPVEALAQESPASGSLVGFVYKDDLKTPVKNAVVKIRNTKDGKEYQSSPTDKNGLYTITGIEEGRYVLGVTTEEGKFNLDFMIFIKANETAKLSLALKSGATSVVVEKTNNPGKSSSGKGSFFKKPFGIVLIIGASAGAILGTIGLIQKGNTTSQSEKK